MPRSGAAPRSTDNPRMLRGKVRCIPMLPVMQVGRVRPGAPPEHDFLHPVGGGLGQARPTNNIGIHGGKFLTASSPCLRTRFGL